MNRRTARPRNKTSAKPSRFPLELTRREAFLWLGVAAFAMLWMFTLGVIVGRGHSPVRFDIENIKSELNALKEQALQKEANDTVSDGKITSDKMSFDFYEALTDKKEEARFKSAQKALEKPTELSAKGEAPAKAESSRPQAKTPEKKKQAQQQTLSAGNKTTTQTPFAIQVASLQDLTKAKDLVSALKRKGYTAYSVKVRIPEKGIYYRVRVGHFKSRHEASQILAKLRQRNPEFDPLIIRK
ncbi:MAG: SPOR domain-containing protein [Thermodesulfobacteriota bacterium]|nr:SPOR domain-containing protein [Thermodesulfobacteriota bacterium]